MANSSYSYKELRFVIEPLQTQCYVLLEAQGDSPISVQGWHHKTFPVSRAIVDILYEVSDAVTWPQKAPEISPALVGPTAP